MLFRSSSFMSSSLRLRKSFRSPQSILPTLFSIHLRVSISALVIVGTLSHKVSSRSKVITSFSMFYDLEDPCEFARQVYECLDSDGIWVLEQSYMPEMLRVNSFDTVCHEHLSYYGMRQLKYIMDKAGFKIVDFDFNDVNGGSISVVVAKSKIGRAHEIGRAHV